MSVQFEKQGARGVVRLDHVANLNALSPGLLAGIEEALDRALGDIDVRVLLITGAGRAFSAGADIRFMSSASVEDCRQYLQQAQELLKRIESIDIPVIAVVNGVCTGGGCALAGCCDITIASETATFGEPEACIGLPGGFGNISRLVRRVGLPAAAELLLTGRIIDAHVAQEMGLVSRVVPAAELWNASTSLADDIAANAPTALAHIKRILQSCQDSGAEEIEAYLTCVTNGEGREGMQAFLEKRKPNWRTR